MATARFPEEEVLRAKRAESRVRDAEILRDAERKLKESRRLLRETAGQI